MSHLDMPWIDFSLPFSLPKYYFYLHDNCSYCSQFYLQVPFLSTVFATQLTGAVTSFRPITLLGDY